MSDCGCIYVDSSEEHWTRTEKICVSRKIHKCDECGRVIGRGEQYESVRWYGSASGQSHTKTCMVCREIRNTFFCNGYWATMVIDNLFSHLEEIQGEVSSECLSGLSQPARERVCNMIEEIWEYYEDEDDDVTKVNKERKAVLYFLRKTADQFESFANQFKNSDSAKPFRDVAGSFRKLYEEIENGDHIRFYNRKDEGDD